MRSPLAPETLARTLRAVAAELERDPALARRVAAAVAADPAPPAANPTQSTASNDAVVWASGWPPTSGTDSSDAPLPAGRGAGSEDRHFRPRLITGASPDLGPGIPDPFTLYQQRGADGLCAVLDELRLGTLRAIVREHGLDPKGTLSRQNDAAKLRAAILAAATARK